MPEPIEVRRKRLLFRSQHRGTKELDLFVGRFAECHLDCFDEGQLDRFEALLNIPEPLIYSWILDQAHPGDGDRSDVLELLLAFDFPAPGPLKT
jgi:antitoxin CptB